MLLTCIVSLNILKIFPNMPSLMKYSYGCFQDLCIKYPSTMFFVDCNIGNIKLTIGKIHKKGNEISMLFKTLDPFMCTSLKNNPINSWLVILQFPCVLAWLFWWRINTVYLLYTSSKFHFENGVNLLLPCLFLYYPLGHGAVHLSSCRDFVSCVFYLIWENQDLLTFDCHLSGVWRGCLQV